ncbi:MAG: hypothetical protein V1794_00010 [Candidatus Glassbacteria bacterium]
MDTDDLTEKSYHMIRIAGGISDYLRCDIGVRSRDYNNEDDYLLGILAFLNKICTHTEEYLNYWNIDSIEPNHFKAAVLELVNYVSITLDTPIEERK